MRKISKNTINKTMYKSQSTEKIAEYTNKNTIRYKRGKAKMCSNALTKR